jgi:steroid 5-alpha reductase family enzyme
MDIFDLLLPAALTILILVTLVYGLSTWKKNAGIMDVAWGLGFIFVAKILLFAVDRPSVIHKLVVLLIYIWGMRLAAHILLRSWGKGEDWRYAKWRKEWGKNHWWRSFLQINLLQGFFMLLVSVPILSATLSVADGMSFWAWLGATTWVIGFFFEAVGDYQLSRFLRTRRKGNEIMHTGLWRYTRHPNYFGEIAQWWGLWLIIIGQPYWQIAIISPVVITYLLLKVSGITMLESKYDNNKKYQIYKKRTSALIPLPPKTLLKR